MKKALIVGGTDYGHLAPPLTAPSEEAIAWADLLVRHYGFTAADIELLTMRPTVTAVRDSLRRLLSGAAMGAQRVFIFCGYGTRLIRSGFASSAPAEGLVCYPETPTADLQTSTLFDVDIQALHCAARLPTGVATTYVVDACFSGGTYFHDESDPSRFVPLRIEPSREIAFRERSIVTDDIASTFLERIAGTAAYSTEGCIPPVLVAGSHRFEIAVELTIGGKRRTLFSFYATEALNRNPRLSYEALVATIEPMMAVHFPQTPVVYGDPKRTHLPFFE